MDTWEDYRKEKLENARIGYQAALQHAANEKNMIWVRSSGMLVANSIIIAVLSSLLTTLIKEDLGKLVEGIAMLVVLCLEVSGILFCLLWIVYVERTSKFEKYYVLSARELEEEYLGNVKTLERGGCLAGGYEVPISIRGGVRKLKIAGLATWCLRLHKKNREKEEQLKPVPVRKSPKLMGVAFAVLYVLFLILTIFGVKAIWGQPADKGDQALMELKDVLIKHMTEVDAIEKRISDLETKSENEIKLLKNQLEAQQKPLESR